MEVHQHTHTERKKLTHYLWEFLMLFLAVFCGFLAENQREHMVEKQREKEYIKLLIDDFQADTNIIHGSIPAMKQTIKGLDTLIDEMYAYLQGKADTRKIYYTYHHYCRNQFNVVLSQRAINQLKNSGNIRLIHDKEALNIILDAEVGFQQLEERTMIVGQRQENCSQFGTRIFDFREYQKANTNPDGSIKKNENGFLTLNYQPVFNTNDAEYIKEFIARVGYYRNTLNSYILIFQHAVPDLETAITKLKKNYKL